jgi:hypothetical protein
MLISGIMGMDETATRRWVDAGIILARDPSAKVDCPQCVKGPLSVTDSSPYGNPPMISRYLSCPLCGAKNVLDRLKLL